ncbi:TonB-linked SusC/RagA family outer membrane protein [Anseongella ginsenosidimutans]|uniref:TonB-linked SusC/RagA family outer membrane protein n=1 Tax=Anseongella ginsenosidimutans TaxID=496056 RepID=A0A4R3KPN4_9SPHI|nr:TonB-dependent receptor [Anseongella ginsenosidimutans]QEC52422.1 TonB-dependent receptor [Anseongella ginsenosidimutans]TCS85832.1 TonB-linked SusC/RagA family outer membrane protein [Anseongella ginsenosidimutans]
MKKQLMKVRKAAGMACLLLVLLVQAAFGQVLPAVSGTVADSSGAPLPGVSVLVKGTQNGASTNADGSFSLQNVAGGATLVFSFIGYQAQEVPVNGREVINVTLQQDLQALDEVVVVGYGTVKKSDLTGAVASVKAEELATEGLNTVAKALQGKVAGVTIESAGGDPGMGTRIMIRGVGSLNNNNPLYLVDGVPVPDINNISPNDIASIEVLKDASAAAIYGSRAANGVVLITTKSGEAGKTQVIFNANAGVQRLAKKIDVLNAQEWASVSNAAHDAAGLPRLEIAEDPALLESGLDWQDEVYRTAPVQNYELSITGGNKGSQYSVSGGYFNQRGLVKVTGYERLNLRVKSETTKGRFRFGETLLLSQESWTKMPGGWGGQGGNPVGSAVKMIPVFDIYDTTAVGGFAGAYGPVLNVANPLAQLHLEDIRNRSTDIVLNFFGEVELLPGLSYKLNLGYNNTHGYDYDYERRYQVGTLFTHQTNDLSEDRSHRRLLMLENTLNFTREFGKHSLQALAGYTMQQNRLRTLWGSAIDLPDGIKVLDAAASNPATGGNLYESALLSMLGRVVYSYDSRYLLTASFRRDGSSRFGDENRYGNFPSIALGWNISNETFFDSFSQAINRLKLRGSYGVLGNQEIGDYLYSAAIASNINYVTGADQHKWFGAIQTAFADPDIKWENSSTFNIGVDLGAWQDKLTFTADYFIKRSTDVLLNVPIPGSTGAVGNPVVNAGIIENRGLEASLGYSGGKGDFNYDVYGTISAINNEVERLGTGTQQIFGGQPTHHGSSTTLTQAGGEVGAFYLVKTDGIFNSEEEVQAHSKNGTLIQPNASPGDIRFVDANGDGSISDEDRVHAGSAFPDFTYGLGFNAQWRNFDLGLFFQGTQGNMIYNGFRQDIDGMNLEINYSKATLNAWTPENHTDFPRAVINDPNYNTRTSDRFLEDGSYLRLKSLQLGYLFPAQALERIGAGSLRVYLSFDNLFTITGYDGYNPDLGRTGSILNRGVDYGHVAYPLARTANLGVQLQF